MGTCHMQVLFLFKGEFNKLCKIKKMTPEGLNQSSFGERGSDPAAPYFCCRANDVKGHEC